jgi:hypothetical protein
MRLTALLLAFLLWPAGAVWSQSVLAGTAQNAKGVLVIVRSDGVETRLQGKGSIQIFDGDVLRVDGQGAFIETDGIQIALNGNAIVKVQSRWEKGKGVTRILRLQRGEVWARSSDGQRPVEIETPVAVLAARSAEVSVRYVSDNETTATVIRGTAEFATPRASCRLTSGTVSSASRGRTCTQPTVADVRPVTDWSHPLLNP